MSTVTIEPPNKKRRTDNRLEQVKELIDHASVRYFMNSPSNWISHVFLAIFIDVIKNPSWKSDLEHCESDFAKYSKNDQEEISREIKACSETKDEQGKCDWLPVLDLLIKLERRDNQRENLSESPPSPTPDQKQAIEKSWARSFQGNAADNLWKHITANFQQGRLYARYLSIVQSSGMGKSRAVDELAKHHFVIPMSLRPHDSSGFPPPDDILRNFLTKDTSDTSDANRQTQAYHRASAFLSALFTVTLETLQGGFANIPKKDFPSQFRKRMADGQTFLNSGSFRRGFFEEVVQNATSLLEKLVLKINTPAYGSSSPPRHDELPNNIVGSLIPCDKLIEFLSAGKGTSPALILLFDEAHSLTYPPEVKRGSPPAQWTVFNELRRALRGLLSASCFSLFLSTTGKISQFTPSRAEDSSARVFSGALELVQPFTTLGFDHLADKISLDGTYDMDTLVSDKHMAHLGRPLYAYFDWYFRLTHILQRFGSMYDDGTTTTRDGILGFAMNKLLNAELAYTETLSNDQILACLSMRVPLEFNSTTYAAKAAEMKQVEGHLRICLKVSPGSESIVTLSPSEPLLSQAACSIMKARSIDIPQAMKIVLDEFSIYKGDRGELLAMLLLTVAHDNALPSGSRLNTVPDLLKCLFHISELTSSGVNQLSQDVFSQLSRDLPNSSMHFTQFIKVHDYAALEPKRLLLLASRGTAVLCADNQRGIDGVNPFLWRDKSLKLENLGLILWQSKNESIYGDEPEPKIFDAMDPVEVRIIKAGDRPIRRIVKIVFLLASKKKALKISRRLLSGDVIVYEIWCTGLSPEIYSAIQDDQGQAGTWQALLQASYGWQEIYQGEGAKREKKMAHPGGASHIDHWSQWTKPGVL